MKTVYYRLYHEYEYDNGDVYKFIGIYSTAQKAKEAIELLFKLPGFKDYPKKSFQIYKTKVDRYGWKEGFISCSEASEYDNVNNDK